MRKLWILAVVLLLLGGACAAVVRFPAIVYVPLGLVRQEAFFSGKPTNYWIRAVQGEGYLGEAAPKMDVGQTLRDGGKESVAVLIQMAQDPDRNVRRQALLALSYIGSDAKSAGPVLAETMKTEDNIALFLSASAALAKADPLLECETLAVVLRDKANHARRSCAISVLLDSAAQCPDIVPAVQELYREPEIGLRIEAIRVLGRLGQPKEPLATSLCEIVSTPQVEKFGVQAIEALGELGAAGKPGVPLLVKILKDPSTRSSGRNFGPPHMPGVVIALGRIGPDAASSLPALERLLAKTKDEEMRRYISKAISQIGAPPK